MTRTMQDLAMMLDRHDFKGVDFFDIGPVLKDPTSFRLLTEAMAKSYHNQSIDYVVGFDARGFTLGGAIALLLGAGFIPLRKVGKLPGKTLQQAYALEYGEAVLEIQAEERLDGKRILLVDDLLATGGTAAAGASLINQLGGTIVGMEFAIELPALHGRSKLLQYPTRSQISIVDNVAWAEVQYCVDLIIRDRMSAKLVLLNRLSTPTGIAMPGGRIEIGESALDAARREPEEEIGFTVSQLQYHTTLVGADRDPRGVMVSIVFTALGVCTNLENFINGESGKTKPFRCGKVEELPTDPQAFAFDDHRRVIIEHLTQQEAAA